VRRSLLLAAVIVLVAAACAGEDSSPIEPAELKDAVLQPADLGAAFVRFDEGRQARIDQPGGTLADVERFGREDGWKARYRRPGSSATIGPLVVESKADAFESAEGAARELEAARTNLPDGLRPDDGEPDLGDDAFVATGTEGSGQFAVRSYLVRWRHENAAASVLANGFEGKITREQVLALAREQQQRLADAD
jgi:hypothetical protein